MSLSRNSENSEGTLKGKSHQAGRKLGGKRGMFIWGDRGVQNSEGLSGRSEPLSQRVKVLKTTILLIKMLPQSRNTFCYVR